MREGGRRGPEPGAGDQNPEIKAERQIERDSDSRGLERWKRTSRKKKRPRVRQKETWEPNRSKEALSVRHKADINRGGDRQHGRQPRWGPGVSTGTKLATSSHKRPCQLASGKGRTFTLGPAVETEPKAEREAEKGRDSQPEHWKEGAGVGRETERRPDRHQERQRQETGWETGER